MVDRKTVEATALAHGFTLRDTTALPEISGDAYLLDHKVSGARLLYLANDDNDKGFSISFKTPASDDTGVFHILEHSVLCGSDKFPVKEPFVNLLKSSMETFLNAMTFPDKTMYPVSSTNEQDLLNLADVYMDAVFHPLIYMNKRIFEQEGWHIEVANNESNLAGAPTDLDDMQSRPHLVYNGVVFNEMKGALSDPDSVLADTLSQALFPDTTYRFESGGDPSVIPTLTYDAFLANHRRHYSADNSYIVLYGNLDIDVFLEFLDDKYLSELPKSLATQSLPTIEMQQPVVRTDVKRKMITAPESACCAYGFVCGNAADREHMLAVSIMLDAIMGSNVSPMKHALLEADIADDINAYLSDSILQPYVVLSAKGLHEDAVAKLGTVIEDVASKLADGALEANLIEASLARAEFEMREANFGVSDSVIYAMASLAGWLYEDNLDAACAYIRYEDAFKSLRAKIDSGYFEGLIREIFIDNHHMAQVEVVPVDALDDPNAERLAKLEKTMTPQSLTQIIKEVEALRVAQEAPDSPDALAKLPKLNIDEIGTPAAEPAVHLLSQDGVQILQHDVDTHGIIYASSYFDLSRVEFDELPYVTILADVLGKMDTSHYSASELDLIVQKDLGSLTFTTDVFEVPNDGFKPKFTASVSALLDKAKDAAAIISEVLTTSNFHDRTKLRDILMQHKVSLESYFANSGNVAASLRASTYYSEAAEVRDKLTNVDFYLFLKDLLDDFDVQFEAVVTKLDDLAMRLFTNSGYVLSFAGGDDALSEYMSNVNFATESESATPSQFQLQPPCPKQKNEAFVVPTDVTYTALSGTRKDLLDKAFSKYSGLWMLASRILTFSYLWNEVRVKGGAYGVNFTAGRSGNTTFASYRDPHIDETLARFEEAGAWLSSADFDEGEFEGYQVSTAATFDKPLKPRDLIRRQALMYFTDYTRDEYIANRKQVIDATQKEVCELGASIAHIAHERNICTIGNRKIIEESGLELSQIVLYGI